MARAILESWCSEDPLNPRAHCCLHDHIATHFPEDRTAAKGSVQQTITLDPMRVADNISELKSHFPPENILEACANHIEVAGGVSGGANISPEVWQAFKVALESDAGRLALRNWSRKRVRWWELQHESALRRGNARNANVVGETLSLLRRCFSAVADAVEGDEGGGPVTLAVTGTAPASQAPAKRPRTGR